MCHPGVSLLTAEANDHVPAAQYSWVPKSYPDQGEACLWDKNYNKKPAYHGVASLLKSAAAAAAGVRRSVETPAAIARRLGDAEPEEVAAVPTTLATVAVKPL